MTETDQTLAYESAKLLTKVLPAMLESHRRTFRLMSNVLNQNQVILRELAEILEECFGPLAEDIVNTSMPWADQAVSRWQAKPSGECPPLASDNSGNTAPAQSQPHPAPNAGPGTTPIPAPVPFCKTPFEQTPEMLEVP